jgi:hypothetical protein
MKSNTRLAKVAASVQKRTTIDKNAKIKKIEPEEKDGSYKCTCCGKEFKRQRENFSPSKSVLFAGNNGFVSICKPCIDKYYYQLVDFFAGNEEKAIERICSLLDWFYDDNAVAASRRISAGRSRISAYPAKLNLSRSAQNGATYLDYIKLKANEYIESQEELDELRQEGMAGEVTSRTITRWGVGYSPEEYKILDSHFKLLKEQAPENDLVTESLLRDLCEIKVQQKRTREKGDVDKYAKLIELYQKTLSTANMKPKAEKETGVNDFDTQYGVWLKDIEKYTPAEYFKDRAIYKDHDSLGSYFNRFIVRPFKNLITGTKEMDEEFSVTGEDADIAKELQDRD